jgi:peptide/nickel transport system substrate-binding protein
VRSADVVASLKRWAVKDAAGQKLLARTASLETVNDKTLVLKLKEPYGLTIRALAKEYSYVPFILPERYAVQDPSKPFEGEVIGSGPFIFSAHEWVPGAKTVYLKFMDYVPRKEPASYYAGGKRANVERVEFVVIPDQSTAVAALEKGFGKKPLYQREGGSIPIVVQFKHLLGIDTVLLGFGLPDENAHAPNEFINLDNFFNGIKTSVHFFDQLPHFMEGHKQGGSGK